MLRTTRTTYNTNSTYLDRHIIGLPSFQYLYQGAIVSGSTPFSKVEYLYDGGSVPSPAPSPSPTPTQHDETWYSPSLVTGRGNLTGVRRYDVTGQATNYVESQTGYNTTGAATYQREPNPSSGVTHQVNFSYTDAFSDNVNRNTYAYLTSVTDADGKVSTIKYDYAWGVVTRTQDPKGAAVTRTYDGAIRPDIVTNTVSGAKTRYVYAADLSSVASYTTIKDASTEFYTITLLDGADRVRAVVKDHPGSVGGYSSVYNVYDNMGRPVQQSNPTEINGGWSPAGDDAYVTNPPSGGYVWNQQAYDWKGRPTVTTNADGTTRQASYGGCGCAGGETVTLTDEIGRQQKIYHDVLGRVTKAETFKDGAVYSTLVNTYNVRDQVTATQQIESSTGPAQVATFDYDGHGRLSKRILPIEGESSLGTRYQYYDDDKVKTVTDPRNVVTTYTYNLRDLVTGISFDATGAANVEAVSPISYTYDAVGNRLTMSGGGVTSLGGGGSVEYHYNQLSQMDWEKRHFSDISQDYYIYYSYNLGGLVKEVKDPFNDVIYYNYDNAGRVSNVTGAALNLNKQFQFTSTQYNSPTDNALLKYRAWGGIKEMTYGNNLKTKVGYDVRMRIQS